MRLKTKSAKTTPCTVEGPLIDKGFSSRVTATFAAAIALTRRAKHWQDAIVAAVREKTSVYAHECAMSAARGGADLLRQLRRFAVLTLTGRAANIPKLTRMSGDVTFFRLPKDGTA
jgi:hypothetical protein